MMVVMVRSGESNSPDGPGSLRPMLAPVVPRVRTVDGGPDAAALPLHERVRAILDGRWGEGKPRGLVSVVGPCGSGKTVALQHLAYVLNRERPRVDLFDGEVFEPSKLRRPAGLVVYASHDVPPGPVLAAFEMAPWGAMTASNTCFQRIAIAAARS